MYMSVVSTKVISLLQDVVVRGRVMSSEAGRMCVWVWAAWLLVASGSVASERESWRQTPQPTTPAQRPWWGATHNVSPAPYPPSPRVTPRRPSPPVDPLLPSADATTHWRRPPQSPRRQHTSQPRHGGWERRPYTHSDHGNTRPRHQPNPNPHPLHHQHQHRHHNSLPTNHHHHQHHQQHQASSSPGMGRGQQQGARGQRRTGRLVPPPPPPQPPPRPNIVLIMTDDQDVELGQYCVCLCWCSGGGGDWHLYCHTSTFATSYFTSLTPFDHLYSPQPSALRSCR